MSDCSICYSEIVGKSRAILGCGHDYHIQCITRWLSVPKRTCPLCRYIPCEKENVDCLNPDYAINRLVDGVTQLMFAASNNSSISEIRSLIQNGENVNAVDGEGDSAIIYSVSNRHENITSYLLTKGANVLLIGKLVAAPQTPDGALAAACTFWSISCFKAILDMPVTLDGINLAYEITVSKSYGDLSYLLLLKKQQIINKSKNRNIWNIWNI